MQSNVCCRCFQDTHSTKPQKVKIGGVGYLRFCDSCYRKKKFLNFGIIVGLFTILGASALAVIFLWNPKIGLNRYGISIMIVYLNILTLRYFRTIFGSQEVAQTIFKHRRAIPEDCFVTKEEKKHALLKVSLLTLFHLTILALLWISEVRYGKLLSNGRDPDSYVTVQKHFGIASSSSNPALLFEVDPLPFIALGLLIIISVVYIWYIRNYHIWKIANYAQKPIGEKSNDLKEIHTKMNGFKVYRDSRFSQIDQSLTASLFKEELF
jgi:hypothetical protein